MSIKNSLERVSSLSSPPSRARDTKYGVKVNNHEVVYILPAIKVLFFRFVGVYGVEQSEWNSVAFSCGCRGWVKIITSSVMELVATFKTNLGVLSINHCAMFKVTENQFHLHPPLGHHVIPYFSVGIQHVMNSELAF
jgi:hypothetical protein